MRGLDWLNFFLARVRIGFGPARVPGGELLEWCSRRNHWVALGVLTIACAGDWRLCSGKAQEAMCLVRRLGASLPCAWLHHGRVLAPTEYKAAARLMASESDSPLIVIPIGPSMASCSKLSRYGLAKTEHALRLVQRPT